MKTDKLLAFGLVAAVMSVVAGAANTAGAVAVYKIAAPDIIIKLSARGNVTAVRLGKAKGFMAVHARSFLRGCNIIGQIVVDRLPGGGIKFTMSLINPAQKRRCVMTQIFTPARHSIRWHVRVQSKGAPWSTPINTALVWPSYAVAMRTMKQANNLDRQMAEPPMRTSDVRFWTSWFSPARNGRVWENPLRPRHFATHTWRYGLCNRTTGAYYGGFTIPLASVIEPARNTGVSLALSPKDVILGLSLRTDANGSFVFRRTYLRIGGGTTVHLTMHLVPQQASWRGGLQWMVHHYPKYFNPPNPAANQMAGCGAYTGYENPIKVPKFKAMAFHTLWQFPEFPYMGMFIPPVSSNAERWHRSKLERTPPGLPVWMTCARLETWARYMKTNGFNLLLYFNSTEFGRNMNSPVRHKPNTPDLWKYPRAFLKYDLPYAAIVPHIISWEGDLVMDCGDPAYRKFLLRQAARMIKRIPDAAGIDIDRLDWLKLYNLHANDGVSWVSGKLDWENMYNGDMGVNSKGRPARALVESWKSLMAKLGPMMHKAGKVIFVNGVGYNNARLDLMRHADGIDAEGDAGQDLNGIGLLCVHKPAILWTYGPDDLKPDPDAYFQRHLYMGIYPYAPYPWNNHCIQPNSWADKYYMEYGPLLNAMRGKQWVLTPHCVAVNNPDVKVNLFRVPGGYVAPVVLGGKITSVTLTIREVAGISAKDKCWALYPGDPEPVSLRAKVGKGALTMVVPLVCGCAMVEIKQRV